MAIAFLKTSALPRLGGAPSPDPVAIRPLRPINAGKNAYADVWLSLPASSTNLAGIPTWRLPAGPDRLANAGR